VGSSSSGDDGDTCSTALAVARSLPVELVVMESVSPAAVPSAATKTAAKRAAAYAAEGLSAIVDAGAPRASAYAWKRARWFHVLRDSLCLEAREAVPFGRRPSDFEVDNDDDKHHQPNKRPRLKSTAENGRENGAGDALLRLEQQKPSGRGRKANARRRDQQSSESEDDENDLDGLDSSNIVASSGRPRRAAAARAQTRRVVDEDEDDEEEEQQQQQEEMGSEEGSDSSSASEEADD